MNKSSWFLFGMLIAAAFKAPMIVGIILGSFLAFRYAKPTPRQQWNYNYHFHNFSQGAYHQHFFSSLGMIAKADGVISKAELAFAKQCMEQMGLNYHQIEMAKSAFKNGSKGINLATTATYMRLMKMQNPNLAISFIRHLEAMANIDPPPSREQLHLINQIRFNIEQNQYQQYQTHRPFSNGQSSLQQAYRTLGVSASKPLKDIKRAYQRLIGKHHPDRFSSQTEKDQAEEKVKQLHAAWETIKRHHPTTQSA